MKSVNEVSRLSGVSRRTLQYYDEIGLLPPSQVKESGYRLYDEAALRRLWTILLYRELGLSLRDIRSLLDNPDEVKKALLQQHRQALLEKEAQLKRLIRSLDRMIGDDFDVSMLSDFDVGGIEAAKKSYSAELKLLTESGFSIPLARSGILQADETFAQNAAKTVSARLPQILSAGSAVAQRFMQAMEGPPDSQSAKDAVAAFRQFIELLIPCDEHTFRTVARAYQDYREEMDEKSPGLAGFVSAAIESMYP